MDQNSFVHLHCHSEFSFLRSTCRIKDLIEKAKEDGQPALAITDYDGMFGVIDFYNTAIQNGIKPIIGCEFTVSMKTRHNPSAQRSYHIVLLARNKEGYQNLMKLSTISLSYGDQISITKYALHKYRGGLICLSGCIRSEIANLILTGYYCQAMEVAGEYKKIFGNYYFYLEIQDHGLPEQKILRESLVQLSHEAGIPLVATNNCHYMNREDSEAHDAMLCIGAGKLLSDTRRLKYNTTELYFKTSREMRELFADIPEALANTVRIAEECNVGLELGKTLIPKIDVPSQYQDEALWSLAEQGFHRRFPVNNQTLLKRLQTEFSLIREMKIAGYILIVRDIIQGAREMGIAVGPGRGSVVGSLISYCLGITSVNPMRYQLLFERFLNPERLEMPDIDIDLADRDCDRVIQAVGRKFGKDCVCRISTLARMKAKQVIRYMGQVLDLPQNGVEKIARLIPEHIPGLKPGAPKLPAAIERVKKLRDKIESSESFRKLWKYACALEGLARQPGVHAWGVIIAPNEVVRFAPLFFQEETSMAISQYDVKQVESVGLLKINFLGLRNLAVIQETCRACARKHRKAPDMEKIPTDDPETLKIFCEANTIAVFQFESEGMREYLKKLQPSCLEDLIAMNALYRPGPMDFIDSFIKRKQGKETIDFHHPDLEAILKETYGLIVYQEQVMQIAHVFAGFSLATADIMRRAMGKKKIAEMEKIKAQFLTGARKKRHSVELAVKIYELLARFAEYGFNKSHATAYTIIAWQTAYLKAHYPVEFMAANIKCDAGDNYRVAVLMDECKRMGLELPLVEEYIHYENMDLHSKSK